MRIVGGKHRGRKLESPEDERVRPTSDRARESLFNILAHGKFAASGVSPLIGARVVDAFCGTGALGFEALSRGAAHATFIDNDGAALKLVTANAKALGESANMQTYQADATKPGRATQACTIAFLDPPYREGLAMPALAALAANGWLADGAICIVETEARDDVMPPAGFTSEDERRYGKAKLTFLRYLGAR
jgi:16S rRNA (guanine966-N2)-methyltransferase